MCNIHQTFPELLIVVKYVCTGSIDCTNYAIQSINRVLIGTHLTNMNPQIFEAEWDAEGVYFYQAYNDQIADYALAHQRLGGPNFNASRMTWIKPSFAWVLFRSGYARKHNQGRILKIKLSHQTVAGKSY